MKYSRLLLLEIQPLLAASLATVAKAEALGYLLALPLNPGSVAVVSFLSWMLITSWTLLLPQRRRARLLFLLSLALSGLFLADLLFYRYYGSLVPYVVLYQSGQIEGVWRSVLALLSWRDPLLFADLFLLVPYLNWWPRRAKEAQALPQPPAGVQVQLTRAETKRLNRLKHPRPTLRGRAAAAGVTALAVTGTLLAGGTGLAAEHGRDVFSHLYSDDTVLWNAGPVGFHLVDVVTQVTESASPGVPVTQLRAWQAVRQRQGALNLHGAAKGLNVIVVQMESLQEFVIRRSVAGQEITPNLNRLSRESLYFDDFFTQVAQGNTADSEFMALNSLYPAPAGAVNFLHPDNTFSALPALLKEDAGYRGAYVFHGYEPGYWNREGIYPQFGIDRYYNQSDYAIDEIIGIGLSDESFYRQTLPKLKQLEQPFFAMVISLTAHHPFRIPAEKRGLQVPDGYSEVFGNYLQAQHYADQALGELVDGLRDAGLLDRSLLVVYGDHFGTGWTMGDIEQFLELPGSMTAYQSAELNRVPLLIRLPGGRESGTRSMAGGQMDIYPTLANLLGLSREKTFLFGRDLLNDPQGLTLFRRYLPEGSFASDDLFFIASEDGDFEHGQAWDRRTGTTVSLLEAQEGYAQARWVLEMSDRILKSDGLPALLPELPQ